MVFEVVREGLTKLETRNWKREAENKKLRTGNQN
jgi:hypothetical protein